MSDMQTTDSIVAIAASDWHLSHQKPSAIEGDWYEAMASTISQIVELGRQYKCPLLISGDLFHKWNSPPELINFAINMLSLYPDNQIYSIVGQHDLPYHDGSQLAKSAYFTLMASEVIQNLNVGKHHINSKLVVHAFPWGHTLTKPDGTTGSKKLNIALCHEYIWRDKKTAYTSAPPENCIEKQTWKKRFDGYHACFFGDNHIPFISGNVVNCGALMQRNIDQIRHKPAVYLLKSNGCVIPHYLDSPIKFKNPEIKTKSIEIELTEFLKSLQGLTPWMGDFSRVVSRYIDCNSVSDPVKTLLLEILNDSE